MASNLLLRSAEGSFTAGSPDPCTGWTAFSDRFFDPHLHVEMGVSGRILQKWPTGKYMVSAHTGNSFRNSLESHKGGANTKPRLSTPRGMLMQSSFWQLLRPSIPRLPSTWSWRSRNNYIETNERRRYGVSSSAVQLCVCGQHLYAQCVYTNGLDMFGWQVVLFSLLGVEATPQNQ